MPSRNLAESRSRSACAAVRRQAISEALRILADPRADRAKQLQILQTLGEVRLPVAVPAMLRLGCESSDNALRSAALTALAGYDDPAIAVRGDQGLCQHARRRAGRRPEPARGSTRARQHEFLKAIEAGTIDSHSVPREIVEKLMLLGDPAINSAVTRLWGPVKPASSAELHARIDRLAAVIREGSGIPKPGKKIFDQQCARCHTLFGQGGKLGPDLTTYRRDDLDAMLLNIVNPSAEIREGFAGSIVAAHRRPNPLRRDRRARQERRHPARKRWPRRTLDSRFDRHHAAWPEVAHARRIARRPDRPASPRPVRLPPKHAAAHRLIELADSTALQRSHQAHDFRNSPDVDPLPRAISDPSRERRAACAPGVISLTADPRCTSSTFPRGSPEAGSARQAVRQP